MDEYKLTYKSYIICCSTDNIVVAAPPSSILFVGGRRYLVCGTPLDTTGHAYADIADASRRPCCQLLDEHRTYDT